MDEGRQCLSGPRRREKPGRPDGVSMLVKALPGRFCIWCGESQPSNDFDSHTVESAWEEKFRKHTHHSHQNDINDGRKLKHANMMTKYSTGYIQNRLHNFMCRSRTENKEPQGSPTQDSHFIWCNSPNS